tara:strand:+ start:753 stop:1115 length:363 start_codon:yes stop_codon:yes gene_type:complete
MYWNEKGYSKNKRINNMLKKDLEKKVKELEKELEYSNKRFQYLQYVWFDLYVNKTHTSLTNRLVYSVKECVFCSKEIKDWGNNSQPIQKGRCCDDCNKKLVIPFRIQELRKQKQEIDEKE